MNSTAYYMISLLGMILSALVIVSLSTDHWEMYEVIDGSFTDPVSVGLWRLCKNNDCYDFSERETSDALKVVRAFVFMAMLMGMTATLFAARLACGRTESGVLAPISFFCLSLFLFIGMLIYSTLDVAQEIPGEYPKARTAARFYGYSYLFGWVTCVFSLIAFLLCMWLQRVKKDAS